MQENLILAYYAQIWKFGPGPPEMEFFKNFSFLWKGLQISLPASPQPPPDIKFKSRKRDFGLCPNMEIRPQAPKNGIFQNCFIIVERCPDFASNEPSTTPRTLSVSQVMQENVIMPKYGNSAPDSQK